MFNFWKYFSKKSPATIVRKWRHEDALAIYGIEQKGQKNSDERQLSLKTLFNQIGSDLLYGVVATENEIIHGFGAAYLGKTHEVMIYALSIDEDAAWGKYGTAIIRHFLSMRARWGKIFLSTYVSEDDEEIRKFFMDGNGFVITEMNECFDDPADPAHVVYTLQYPPPEGHDPKKIAILVNGGEKRKTPATG